MNQRGAHEDIGSVDQRTRGFYWGEHGYHSAGGSQRCASGDVPLHVGQTCPLTVHLPNQESPVVAAAIVRWVRDWDQEYGMETLVVNKRTQSRVERLVRQLEQVAHDSIE
ncbi:MAG: hypothetical protein ACREJN_10960 [Nitrospiraceae bacterium]